MEQKKRPAGYAPVFVLIAGTLWGSMGLFVRRLGSEGTGLSSLEVAQTRCLVAAALLLVYILARDRSLLRIRLRDLWCFVGTGIFSIILFNYCYFTTIEKTSLSVAAVLLYTAPAFVIVLSAVLFREKITGRKIAALVLTLLGCICVSGLLRGGGAAMTPAGFFTGLGAGFGYALYSIFSRYALERGYGSITITFYTFLVALIGMLPLVPLSGIGRAVAADPSVLAVMIVFGIVTTVIPYLSYTRGLEGMENGKASIIASVEPVVATILGILVFHETLHADEAAGIVLILGAILLQNTQGKHRV